MQGRPSRLSRINHGESRRKYCVEFGAERAQKYPSNFFCSACDLADEYFDNHQQWPPGWSKSPTYRCTASHSSSYESPSHPKQGCYHVEYGKSKKVENSPVSPHNQADTMDLDAPRVSDGGEPQSVTEVATVAAPTADTEVVLSPLRRSPRRHGSHENETPPTQSSRKRTASTPLESTRPNPVIMDRAETLETLSLQRARIQGLLELLSKTRAEMDTLRRSHNLEVTSLRAQLDEVKKEKKNALNKFTRLNKKHKKELAPHLKLHKKWKKMKVEELIPEVVKYHLSKYQPLTGAKRIAKTIAEIAWNENFLGGVLYSIPQSRG